MIRSITHLLWLLIIALIPSKSIYAQSSESITVNNGQLYIMPNTLISTYFDFKNSNLATVFNNGEFQFYKDLYNDGLFTYSTGSTSSLSSFKGIEVQKLLGSKPIQYFNVLFDNSTKTYAFDLKNEISIEGTADFSKGIVRVNQDNTSGVLFGTKGKHIHTSDLSYIEGAVDKVGDTSFIFPIGKKGLYRRAAISALEEVLTAYSSEYFFEPSDAVYPHQNRQPSITEINKEEYWIVKQVQGKEDSAIITLSWDERSIPKELLVNPEKQLHIVSWDDKQKLWIDQGGVVDLVNKQVSTPIEVKGMSVFTLGLVAQEDPPAQDIVIYNAVSPNGDGKNDYFFIENINRFPNNTVEIYNRWGVKVYDTKNYDSAGNVFRGYSNGRATLNKSDRLATGTYYYVVTYQYSDSRGTQMKKKTGYLHLENQ
ncbi:gliding motility-associated C-terminal domain-containing protein [Myroides sp.]|uniref:gliding motility-associated C-terminal domain-containing protein n=1 Tax=Myroides sp. TaxID=1874736 RepID=UPI003F3CB499